MLEFLRGRTTFGATELERFVDCSSAWLFERVISPRTIDAEADAMLRGSVAHQTLYTFYSRLPKELGVERIGRETLAAGAALPRGVPRRGAARRRPARARRGRRGGAPRGALARPRAVPPRRGGVGADADARGASRSASAPTGRRPELQRGLELGDGLFVSGKIDRIDIDPFSARGIVQDYKSGKGSFSARQIDDERRLQVPLYMLVLRDLVGVEPLGGVYRALSGARSARGMLRGDARDDLPGFKPADYLEDEAFWGQVETARARAKAAADRIRRGDVAHDPRGGECPTWCDLWTMCRVART